MKTILPLVVVFFCALTVLVGGQAAEPSAWNVSDVAADQIPPLVVPAILDVSPDAECKDGKCQLRPSPDPISTPLGGCGPDCDCTHGECGQPNCPTRKTIVHVSHSSGSGVVAEQAEDHVVLWRHAGPIRRAGCFAVRAGCGVVRGAARAAGRVVTGNGPIARRWRARRCGW